VTRLVSMRVHEPANPRCNSGRRGGQSDRDLTRILLALSLRTPSLGPVPVAAALAPLLSARSTALVRGVRRARSPTTVTVSAAALGGLLWLIASEAEDGASLLVGKTVVAWSLATLVLGYVRVRWCDCERGPRLARWRRSEVYPHPLGHEIGYYAEEPLLRTSTTTAAYFVLGCPTSTGAR
jgi:hypothetical protein